MITLATEDAIRELNARAGGAGLEAIGPLFLRSEAVASSRIEAYQATSPWMVSFAEAVAQAATEGLAMAADVDELRTEWFERSGRPRRDSSAARLLEIIPASPILSASTASKMIGASPQRTLDGLKRLESVGVQPGTATA